MSLGRNLRKLSWKTTLYYRSCEHFLSISDWAQHSTTADAGVFLQYGFETVKSAVSQKTAVRVITCRTGFFLQAAELAESQLAVWRNHFTEIGRYFVNNLKVGMNSAIVAECQVASALASFVERLAFILSFRVCVNKWHFPRGNPSV